MDMQNLMNRLVYISVITLLFTLGGCNDKDFLDREPTDVLTDEQLWSDHTLILSLLADLYDRIPEYQSTQNWWNYADFDVAFGSSYGDYWRSKNNNWDYNEWTVAWYDYYSLIREVNLFIQKAGLYLKDNADAEIKARFIAEGRFIRAAIYFEMVKRVGGVPLITEPLAYDFSGDPSYLQHARAKEYEIYDFILSELDQIQNDLPNDVDIKSRATQGLVLAMKSRAALYAASIAKYGTTTPEVSLPGEEVGIESSKADLYYQKALSACEQLLDPSKYSYALYQENNEDLSDNFASLFIKKNNNNEVIFVKDFKLQSGKTVNYTVENQPWSGTEDLEGGRLNPSLNLVQSFEMLDNTFQTFHTQDENGNYLFFSDPIEMFEGRDARLKGTVLVPGSQFKGKDVDIWAGYVLADGSIITGDTYAQFKKLPGEEVEVQVVGKDGPINGLEFSAQTGFYCRKYLDPATGSGQRGLRSETWWIRYRLAEVYLNAAEASFELGKLTKAAEFLNEVRQRAGFTKDLREDEITFDRIVHERKVELAFEGHILWDMKRWRLAHKVWNGEMQPLTDKPWKADEVSNRVFGLWPYKYCDPGNENDGKYLFEQVVPAEVTGADYFRLGNYYSRISDDVLSKNPLLVKNPNQ